MAVLLARSPTTRRLPQEAVIVSHHHTIITGAVVTDGGQGHRPRVFYVCEKFIELISPLSILVKMVDLIQSQFITFSGNLQWALLRGCEGPRRRHFPHSLVFSGPERVRHRPGDREQAPVC